MGLFTGIRDYLKKVSSKETELPDIVFIPSDHTDEERELDILFEPDKHYFTVRVNELFLPKQMEWLNKYQPVVLAVTEFMYDKKAIEHPFVVGLPMLEGKVKAIPNKGMIYEDTRVAGIQPFKGGKIVTTVVLCKANTGSVLTDTINFIGKVSGIFSKNISKLVGEFILAAQTVMDGVDALFKNEDLIPVMGYRKEFDMDANDNVRPGYFVLINKSAQKWDQNKFFVKDKRLHYGDAIDSAKEFAELGSEFTKTEYVLFSLTQTDVRTDYMSLPFYDIYEQIMRDIRDKVKLKMITQEVKDEVVNRLNALSFDMELSPDLTSAHAQVLAEVFFEKIKGLTGKEFKWAAGSGKKEETFWTKYREKLKTINNLSDD